MAEDWRSFILEGFMPHYSMSTVWLPSESLKEETTKKVVRAVAEALNEQGDLKVMDSDCGCAATVCDTLPVPPSPNPKFQDVKELLAHARAIVHDFRSGVGVGELAEQHQVTVIDVEEIIRFAMEMPR